MNVVAIKTSVFSAGMDLSAFILKHTQSHFKENSILAITSKIVSLSEGRVVSKKNHDKKKLIQKECQHDLGSTQSGFHLTIQHHLMLPSAGIDESNSPDGNYILYPKDPYASLKKLYHYIQNKLHLKHFGLIMTDSKTTPLRKGVIGVSVSYYGFSGVSSLIGSKDLFDKTLRFTSVNRVDALAASAVLLMGEGNKCCPLAIIHSAPVVFTLQTNPSELHIPIGEDLYFPLYKDRL